MRSFTRGAAAAVVLIAAAGCSDGAVDADEIRQMDGDQAADDLDADAAVDASEPAEDSDAQDEADPADLGVSDTVEPVSDWITGDRIAGGPLHEVHLDGLVHPPSAVLDDEQEAVGNAFTMVARIVVEGVEDARGVFDGYLEQYLDAGWDFQLQHQDGPTEVQEGEVRGVFVGVESGETFDSGSGDLAAELVALEVVTDGQGVTFVKIDHSVRDQEGN